MKLVKFTVFTFIILASISAGVIYYVFSHIDEYIVDTVEQAGSELTQTVVGVDRADVHLTQGSGALYNLSIANPDGYSANKLYISNRVALSVDVSSVNQPVKIINKVDVRDIYFSVEQKGVKNNLQVVMGNIRSANNTNTLGKLDEPHLAQAVDAPVRAMIKRMTFSEVQVELYVDNATAHRFTVPGFFLENIGDEGAGLSLKGLGRYITLHLMSVVNTAVQYELAVLSGVSLQSGGQNTIQEGANKGTNKGATKSAQDILGEQLLNASPNDRKIGSQAGVY